MDRDIIFVVDPVTEVVDDLDEVVEAVDITVTLALELAVEELVVVFDDRSEPVPVADTVLVREDDTDCDPVNDGLAVRLAAEERVLVLVLDSLGREVAEAEDVRVEVELLVPDGDDEDDLVITGARDLVEVAEPDFVRIVLRVPREDAVAVRVPILLREAVVVAEEDRVETVDLVALAVAELERLCLVEAV